MPQAVQFDEYGGPDVMHVVDVEPREPDEGEVLVRV
jgi:NADPH:quinone reductase-like Zn-dependent oxidoreductase